MDNRQQEQPANQDDDNISFDFWKTNYSGHLEKSLRFHDSPLRQDLFEGIHRTEDDLWRVEGFDKNTNRRLQNKMNARRAREKRKGELEDMRIRIQNLEIENRNLKQQKTCRRCTRAFDSYHHHSVEVQSSNSIKEHNPKTGEQLMFQELKPTTNNRREWRSKLWLAIGLLMLIIGLQMHGFTGSDQKSVRVCEQEARNWAAQFSDESKGNIRIRMKTKTSPSMQDEKWEGNKPRQKESWLNSISFESEQAFISEERDEQLTELHIDKDLLFSIQAEFDDIGRYI